MRFSRRGGRALVLVSVLVLLTSGCQLWVSRYNGPGNGIDQAPRVVVSPSGDRLFVSGTSFGQASGGSISTVAYDPANGDQSWSDVYADASSSDVAVSPDGSQVFATGPNNDGTNNDFVTIAYEAASGQHKWVRRYNGSGDGNDNSESLAVSPDGARLFVTGSSVDAGSSAGEYTTVAYDTATGTTLWVANFSGTGGLANAADSVGVSPDGTKVFVTGSVFDNGAFNMGTIAYNAANGAQLWVSRYGFSAGAVSRRHLVVSPDGSKVVVTATSVGDYATVAYNPATGTQLWASRYNGPAKGKDSPEDLAISPDSTKVFVTGSSESDTSQFPAPVSAATVAYNATDGTQLWVNRYDGGGNASGHSIAVKPDSTKVIVAATTSSGGHNDYVTFAYNAANGSPGWRELYNGPANGSDGATSVAVSPDATKVFVTGGSDGATSSIDFATVAYNLP